MLNGPRVLPKKGVSISLFVLMIFLIPAAAACIREDDLTLEQRLYQLSSQLLCPVCAGQTIDESNAQVAKDMRVKVRELLDQGDTNSEIKDYFVVQYGQSVLGAPPGGGFNILAWVVPVIIVGGGAAIVVVTVRNLRRSHTASVRARAVAGADSATVSVEGLDDYLSQVDRDLGISERSVTGKSTSGGPVSKQASSDKKAGS